ncbi:MAG: DUF1800 family protein [Epsilonproteobacteria bacterium]|nr:DUF1800 family protein [Campylobacterota bacterium]
MFKIIMISIVISLFIGCEDSKKPPTLSTTSTDTKVVTQRDVTAPTIILKDDPNITLKLGQPYKEPGFQAIDDKDGDITEKVTIQGSVDTEKEGIYTLIYTVSDSSGNRSSITRLITILDINKDTNNTNSTNSTNNSYSYIPQGEDLDYDTTFRFLLKTSFGPTKALVAEVQKKGVEAWLDKQLNMTYDKNDSLTYQLIRMGSILNDFAYKYPIEDYLDPNTTHILPPKGSDQEKYRQYFISSWFRETFWSPKQVYMRTAYALSQIVVASSSSGLFNGQHHALAAYYDVIKKNALGNYGDLLKEMSSNPAMGNYLTFYGNQKKYQNEKGEWVYPDENYAREIMQLFSIGPFLLNSDGSKVVDKKGRPVPSYTQDDVNEMARVFTGLDFRLARGKFGNTGLRYGDLIHKMVCFDEYHDSEPKKILGKTIPGGNCYEDINDAVDVLMNHQNTAPFIAKKLIMRLAKSNPSPDYISRVASVFRDTNGNLKETVRAIYLDPELWDDIKNKRVVKYKEPIIAFTQMARVCNVKPLPKWHLIIDSPSAKEVKNKRVEVEDEDIIYIPYGGFGQMPTMAKTVFNFYSDDYIPNDSYFRDNNLVAPELEIQTDGQLVAYHNFMYDILNYEKNYALNRKGLNLYHPYKLKVYKNLKEYGDDLDTIYHPFRLYFDLTKYIKVVEDAFRKEIKEKNLTDIDGKDLEEIFDNAHEKSYRFSEETREKAISDMLDIIDEELLGHTMNPKYRETMVKMFAYELREYRSEDFRRFYFLVVQHLIQKTVILDDYKVE